MHHAAIDYAIIGEAENILTDFLRVLDSGGSLYGVNRIAFRNEREIIITPAAISTSNLDSVPFPARHLLKNNLYHNILSRVKNFTVMLSARGCPYRCIFCDLNTKKFRMRSASNFVDEIETNYKEFLIREFDIYDSSFTIDKPRVIAICNEILKRRLKVSWTARSRVDNMDKGLLKIMAKAGCNTLMYGIESANQDILNSLQKSINIEMIKEIVRLTGECGIKSLGFFIIGSPGETHETAMDTIRFMQTLDLDYVQVTKLTPFPNTQIYRMLMDKGFGDYWREFTLNPQTEREMPLIETELSVKEAMLLVKKAYIAFYFRPLYILRALRRIKSVFELKNSIMAALGLIFHS